MEEWKIYKLGDLYKVHNGLSKSGNFFGSGFPFLSFKIVFNNFFLPQTLSDLVQTSEKERSNYDIKRGDVFITRTSETAEELGMSCVALKDYPNATYNGFTKRLRPINDIVVPEYIGYYLRSPKFRGLFYGLASSMSTRASLANSDLLDMPVSIPSHLTQIKIASILKSLDDKIEMNRQKKDNLEKQTLAIFDHIFPEITRGDNKIGDIIVPKRGRGLLSKNALEGNIPVVAGGINPATYHNTANTEAPVVTIAASGANAGYVNLWHIPVWCSDSSYIDSSMSPNVYFWYVMLKKRQKEIFDAQVGSAQPHIYPKHIAEMPLGNFSKADVEKFTETVKPMFELIGIHKEENIRLANMRDVLLPLLMSGKLEVK